MEREEIIVRFADLRRALETVPAYVQEQSGVDESLTLRTAIEDDLGLAGIDTEELLLAFGTRYQVDFNGFDFTGCISPEPSGNPMVAPLLVLYAVLFVLGWLANGVAALCWAPFNWGKAQLMLRAGIGSPAAIARELLYPEARPRPVTQVLTVGDLVASAAVGFFVKRERVRLTLAK